jgi:hypothetical protein
VLHVVLLGREPRAPGSSSKRAIEIAVFLGFFLLSIVYFQGAFFFFFFKGPKNKSGEKRPTDFISFSFF